MAAALGDGWKRGFAGRERGSFQRINNMNMNYKYMQRLPHHSVAER